MYLTVTLSRTRGASEGWSCPRNAHNRRKVTPRVLGAATSSGRHPELCPAPHTSPGGHRSPESPSFVAQQVETIWSWVIPSLLPRERNGEEAGLGTALWTSHWSQPLLLWLGVHPLPSMSTFKNGGRGSYTQILLWRHETITQVLSARD